MKNLWIKLNRCKNKDIKLHLTCTTTLLWITVYNSINYCSRFKEAKVLLTTELLQLFSMVPAFYQYLGEDDGLENIMNTCFGNVKVYNTFINMINEQKTQQVNYTNLSEYRTKLKCAFCSTEKFRWHRKRNSTSVDQAFEGKRKAFIEQKECWQKDRQIKIHWSNMISLKNFFLFIVHVEM